MKASGLNGMLFILQLRYIHDKLNFKFLSIASLSKVQLFLQVQLNVLPQSKAVILLHTMTPLQNKYTLQLYYVALAFRQKNRLIINVALVQAQSRAEREYYQGADI